MERRRRDREVGESHLTIPPKRTSIFFFKGMDGHFVPMVKAPGYVGKRFPRAMKQGVISR
jgi:hypothetical protein